MSKDESPCPYKLERDRSIRVHQDAVDRLDKFTIPPLQLGNPDCVRYANRVDGPNIPITVSEALLSKGKRKRKRRRKSKKRKTRKRKRKRKNKGKRRKTKKR